MHTEITLLLLLYSKRGQPFTQHTLRGDNQKALLLYAYTEFSSAKLPCFAHEERKAPNEKATA